MPNWLIDARDLISAAALVFLNGFFVAAEFSLVKVRGGRLDLLAKGGGLSARVARWLGQRLDGALSACQLGITVASLGLGWIGEPAFADLLRPLLQVLGVTSPHAVHTAAFALAFSTITALHLVIGEQAPKIFAIRRPERILLWCAIPLALFYYLAFPLLMALSGATSFLLRLVGVEEVGDHETPHTEDEIRAIVAQAHVHGELTRSEERLINAVFKFDDLTCRRVMVPRSDVVFFDISQTVSECIRIFKETKHSRFPVCEGSLDEAIGVLHVKDLVGLAAEESPDLRSLVKPAHHVPETMPVSGLLRHFQSTHQLMALVDDEHGTVVGIVTLENVLEQIVGSVEDEFDREAPTIVEERPGRFMVKGSAPLSLVCEQLNVQWQAEDVDTLSGFLTTKAGRVLRVGDRFNLERAVAEVVEVQGTRAARIQITLGDERLG